MGVNTGTLEDRAGAASRFSLPAEKLFSFPAVIAGMISVLAVLTTRGRLDDPDLWWHLKTGEIIGTSGSIPLTDLFSFTARNQSLVPQEWLSQLSIYFAYRLGGNSGLMLWLVAATIALLLAGYLYCSLYSGNVKAGFAGAMTIWFFATSGMAVRPQMIGYLFLLLELLLIYLGRTRTPAWFLGLPPLFVLWVNCHGSFFLGLIVAVAVLFCSFFEFHLGLLTASRWQPRRRALLGLACVLSAASLWINPVGTRQVFYPLDTMFRQSINLQVVSEWAPLQFPEPRAIGLMVALAGIALLAMVRRRGLTWQELLLLAIGVWLAESHARMAFVFGIVAAPVLARLIGDSLGRYNSAEDRPLLNFAVLAVCAALCWAAFPGRVVLRKQVEEHSPVQAVEFIRSHHLTGNMLNEYVFGGYLIWAAPEHPVFIDGRADVYEWAGVLRQLAQFVTLQQAPGEFLDRYNIAFCLLAPQSPMTRILTLLPGWKRVYADRVSVIFVRADATTPVSRDPRHI